MNLPNNTCVSKIRADAVATSRGFTCIASLLSPRTGSQIELPTHCFYTGCSWDTTTILEAGEAATAKSHNLHQFYHNFYFFIIIIIEK